jgi:hypothetical protein
LETSDPFSLFIHIPPSSGFFIDPFLIPPTALCHPLRLTSRAPPSTNLLICAICRSYDILEHQDSKFPGILFALVPEH